MMKMKKIRKNSSFDSKKYSITNPYVIYKLDGNGEKNVLISKHASLIDNDEKLSKVIALIKNNGNKIYGARLRLNLRTGKLIYRSKDGLYGVWKSNLNNCIYLLLYVDYGDIKGHFKKWVTH
jgi:hypothetical protein